MLYTLYIERDSNGKIIRQRSEGPLGSFTDYSKVENECTNCGKQCGEDMVVFKGLLFCCGECCVKCEGVE